MLREDENRNCNILSRGKFSFDSVSVCCLIFSQIGRSGLNTKHDNATSEIKGKLIPNTTRMDVLTCHLGSHCRNPVEIRNANLQYLGHAGFKTFYFGFDPEVILWEIIEHDETEEHLLSAHCDIPT